LEEVEWTNLALPGAFFRKRDNSAKPRRDENSLPEPVFAGAEGSANFRMHFGNVDAGSVKRTQRRGVALLEERDE
jgi:hypothetical protein